MCKNRAYEVRFWLGLVEYNKLVIRIFGLKIEWAVNSNRPDLVLGLAFNNGLFGFN